MLLSHEAQGGQSNELDSIHNYYENMVFDALRAQLGDRFGNNDYTADIACVALNHLPPRYIRHNVDMVFYLSPLEQQEMAEKVNKAVATAIEFVDNSDNSYESEPF